MSELGIEPRRADDDIMSAHSLYLLLSVKFRKTIDTRRSALLILTARSIVRVAAKDVVGRDMHQQSAYFLHSLGEVLRCRGVEGLDDVAGGLGLVDIRPRGTVDDAFHVVLGHHPADSVQVGDVEFLIAVADIRKDVFILTVLGDNLHLVAQLSVGSCNKYIHRKKVLLSIFFKKSVSLQTSVSPPYPAHNSRKACL